MKILELVGANGVGKTALNKTLKKHKITSTRRAFYLSYVIYQINNHKWTLRNFAYLVLIILPITRLNNFAITRILRAVPLNEKQQKNLDNIIALCLRHKHKPDGISLYDSISLLAAIALLYKEVILMRDFGREDKVVVLDESLIHATQWLCSEETINHHFIRDYINLLPKIDAFIYVTVDVETHMQSIVERGERGHFAKGHREIFHNSRKLRKSVIARREIMELCYEALKDNSVAYIKFNRCEKYSLNEVYDFIKNL